MKALIESIYWDALGLGACNKFTGREDMDGIVRLLFSPQGREFCIKNRFPSRQTFRKFLKYNPELHGVYIDAGRVILKEPKNVFLVGRTQATIHFEDIENHNVCLLHGAKATIYAGGRSVVRIESDDASKCNVIKTGRAVVI